MAVSLPQGQPCRTGGMIPQLEPGQQLPQLLGLRRKTPARRRGLLDDGRILLRTLVDDRHGIVDLMQADRLFARRLGKRRDVLVFVGLNLVQAEQRVSISDFRRKTGGGD